MKTSYSIVRTAACASSLLLVALASSVSRAQAPSNTGKELAPRPEGPNTSDSTSPSGGQSATPDTAIPKTTEPTPSPAPDKQNSESTAAASTPKDDAAAANAQKATDEAVEAEVAAATADSGSATDTDADQGSRVNVYGFADFMFAAPLDKAAKMTLPYSTFAIGHLNVYMSTELGAGWRSLAEVRFMYLPHGTDATQSHLIGGAPTNATINTTSRVDNTGIDPTQPGIQAPIRWGGIDIQRAWLEYTQSEYLTIRAGQFLTPYGIWNVDHGSPTIIGVHMPLAVAAALFPDRQTGLEGYGSFYIKDTQIGYHLTLSNGRGPIDTYRDLDNNKAIGGRVFLKNEALLGKLALGLSTYRGKYTDTTLGFSTSGPTQVVTLQYEELALGADLKWEWENLLVQGEALMDEVHYMAGRPKNLWSMGGFGTSYQPDIRNWGAYGLIGYRTPLAGLMPYFAVDRYNGTPFGYTAYWGGLNWRPIARVVLKAQYTYFHLLEKRIDTADYQLFETQAAWSF